MSQENCNLARRWFEEMWNGRNPDLVNELITPDATCQSESGILVGPETFLERAYRPFTAALPDLSIEIEGTICEDDQLVVRWRARGTHTGEGLGIPPTGRPIDVRGMTWMRCRGGRFHEGQDSWNLGGLLAALAAPEPVA